MAKRFIFRFDTLLKIRRQREEHEQRVVARRLLQIDSVQRQISAIERQIQEETASLRATHQPGPIDLQRAMRYRRWLSRLHKGALEGEARMRFLEARLAQERVALLEATRQRRVLEKLRERQLEKYSRQQEQIEAKEADDMANVRYVFNQGADRNRPTVNLTIAG